MNSAVNSATQPGRQSEVDALATLTTVDHELTLLSLDLKTIGVSHGKRNVTRSSLTHDMA
jgi:hypothetical protein